MHVPQLCPASISVIAALYAVIAVVPCEADSVPRASAPIPNIAIAGCIISAVGEAGIGPAAFINHHPRSFLHKRPVLIGPLGEVSSKSLIFGPIHIYILALVFKSTRPLTNVLVLLMRPRNQHVVRLFPLCLFR
ncbi:hypothetical protein GGI43DRAFT_417620 [Trichoderma evansii]